MLMRLLLVLSLLAAFSCADPMDTCLENEGCQEQPSAHVGYHDDDVTMMHVDPHLIEEAIASHAVESAQDNLEMLHNTADDIEHLDIDDTTVSAGIEHSCAIHSISAADFGGKVLCWGENSKGQADPPKVHTTTTTTTTIT
jgi:hypothetical protein